MTAGKNSGKATVQATVQNDGKVEAMGQLYWSPSMQKFAGWKVELRVFGDGGPVQVWSGHHFLCSADVIADPGFADPATVRKIAAEMGERVDRKRALVVRGQAALVMELLGDAIEDSRFCRKASLCALLTHVFDRAIDFLGIPLNGTIERKRNRDLERTQGREARLRLAQSIFDLPYTINGHRPSSEIDCCGKKAKPGAGDGHCLSEVAK
jgi:hypothetical protein